MILTADKGVSLVVMDTKDYIKKAEDLLNQPTYKSIPTDPTTRCKNKLINAENHQSRGQGQWGCLQKALPHRSRMPQVLWVTKNT